jgi:hypothetical protein
MRGAIPPLPNTPSWRCTQLKKSTGATSLVPFTFYSEKWNCFQDFGYELVGTIFLCYNTREAKLHGTKSCHFSQTDVSTDIFKQ